MKASRFPKLGHVLAERYPRLAERLRERTLTSDEARSFYDHLGRRLDWHAFYETPAQKEMIRALELGRARQVLEFGCGTGRLAETMLAEHLPADARYLGLDISRTMVELTRERIARFGERATVQQSDGGPRLRVESGAFDRIVCTYVLDILSDDDIAAFLEEAHRCLGPGGLMGLTSLTYGHTTSAQLVQELWIALHRANPAWVGGCRPLRLLERLPEGSWRIVDHRVITSYFISCEVLVARRA